MVGWLCAALRCHHARDGERDDDDVGSIFFCCFLNAIPASKWKKWKVEMVNQHASYSATAAMIR